MFLFICDHQRPLSNGFLFKPVRGSPGLNTGITACDLSCTTSLKGPTANDLFFKLAREWDADLIVVGSHGRTALGRISLLVKE